jgi:exopolysaccharide biosynthesis WecB/TagA/CpsF family protein
VPSVVVVVTAVALAVGVPALACAGYLATLSVAALRRTAAPVAGPQTLRVAVVVPAHNEAALIARVLGSLREQTYPASLTRIVVVADNCSDATADVAAATGADVLVRTDPIHVGKGEALRWAFDRLLTDDPSLDALVVVDADSVADHDLLTNLAAGARSAEVVQGDYQVLEDSSSRSALRAAAFLLFHRARFQGRAALGMGCALVGNGMLFRRSVLERVPWNATCSAEDLEYTVNLRLAGVSPSYAAGARLWAPASTGGKAGSVQRMRWEGGRFHMIRAGVPRLVTTAFRSGDLTRLDMAMDLATPPLGLLVLASAAGAAIAGVLVAVHAAAPWALLPWLGALGLIAAHVIVGLYAAREPKRTYQALLGAPWFLLLKLTTYARLTRGTRADHWERTPRDIQPDGTPAAESRNGRVEVRGVPLDDIDRAGAVSTIMGAVARGSFLQVCTVNLHFLVTARRQPGVLQVLKTSGLNVADGAPVVWLGRRLGGRLPERVAGADVVSDLMGEAARTGHRVFMLGGEGGAAAAAAENMVRLHPGLQIAGTYEPPTGSVDDLDSDTILSLLEQARPDILLVALGHPKQELWIHRHSDRLGSSVAIGVGCTLDLLAKRQRRAPVWMQHHGLEWLYRLSRTPGRLLWRYSLCAVWFAAVFAPTATLSAMRRSG